MSDPNYIKWCEELQAKVAKLEAEIKRYRLLAHDSQAHEIAAATLNRTGLLEEKDG